VASQLERTPASVYKALERIRVALHSCIERKVGRAGLTV
jgi:hypothetical protein